MTPFRLQRRRTRGWRQTSPNGLPIVNVSRPSIWGSPFPATLEGIEAYGLLVSGIVLPQMHELGDVSAWQKRFQPYGHPTEWARSTLRGRNLACWCALCADHQRGRSHGVVCSDCTPCHVDPLLLISNA